VRIRREAVAVSLAIALLAAAFLIPRIDLGIIRPLLTSTPDKIIHFRQAPPLYGWWEAHVGWGSIPAAAIGIAAVAWAPNVAQRLPWRTLKLVTWATSFGWAFALAMIDGWQAGFVQRLLSPGEYLRQSPSVTDIPEMLRTFTSRILDFQRDSWLAHISAHPPGALLSFVWLDRLGLHGGVWAGLLCVLVGSSAATAIIIALRALTEESTARAAAPFIAMAPTAIWIAVSADGYFAGVAAWAIALMALAATRTVRFPAAVAAGSGLLLGWAIMLNYGLVLLAIPVMAVLIASRNRRAATTAAAIALPPILAVVAIFLAFGFWWLDAYALVQQRYWQGIASVRPFQYWSWANIASVVCAIGLGSVAGLTRVVDDLALRQRSGLHLLLLAAIYAILVADLSMLSKAEVERIWLPFTIWLTAAPALLPPSTHRLWLAVNVVGALLLNHFIFTNW
jgi:methylthioxylose transferase